MIKSTLTVKQNKKSKFPLLARLKDDAQNVGDAAGTVVFFTSLVSGVVVVASKAWEIGDNTDKWVECNDEKTWEILPPGSSVNLVVE